MSSNNMLDLLISLAYFAITLQILIFLKRTKILEFAFGPHEKQRELAMNLLTVGILFAVFIGLCGFTHFLKFCPSRTGEWFNTLILFATALVSLTTAVACYFIFPLVLKFLGNFEVSSKGKVQLLENYLLEVVELFEESIVVLSPHLRIVRGNSVTSQFFGKHFVGRSMIDIIHPEDFDKFRLQVEKIIWSDKFYQKPIIFEYRVFDPKGVDFLWMESKLCLSSSMNDEATQQDLNMITRNITHLKAFQLNQEREEALRLKEKINESKLKYVSCIAHDLKTPLHSFCFVLDLLKCTKLQDDQLDLLQQAHVSIDLMRLTISQTMDITKSLTGENLMPRRSSVKIGSIVERVKIIINGYGSQVPIIYNVEEKLLNATVLTDEEWLWQMILNLMTNACKYTDRGTVELKISLDTSNEGEKPKLLIEVIDTGVGVQSTKMNKLFDAFAQIQDGQTTGTGLGLFGLKARVERLEGTCGMHSNEESVTGTGSIFWFCIPFILDESNELCQPVRRESFYNSSSTQPIGLSAFVIDDTLSIRKLMTKVLHNIGFTEVECFENGSKGLEAMKGKMVNVVFSDIQMPIMTGPEMIQRFREFEEIEIKEGRRSGRQYVVSLSANGDVDKKRLLGPSGFDGNFTKPVSMEQLKEIVKLM